MEDDGRDILGDFLYLYISLARDGIWHSGSLCKVLRS